MSCFSLFFLVPRSLGFCRPVRSGKVVLRSRCSLSLPPRDPVAKMAAFFPPSSQHPLFLCLLFLLFRCCALECGGGGSVDKPSSQNPPRSGNEE
ncbi:hypothetical protein J3F83DRAFT_741489 [Trichoderma novae-zelandiae]